MRLTLNDLLRPLTIADLAGTLQRSSPDALKDLDAAGNITNWLVPNEMNSQRNLTAEQISLGP